MLFLCRVGTEAIEMTSSLSAYLESISKWTVDVFTYASDCTVFHDRTEFADFTDSTDVLLLILLLLLFLSLLIGDP